MLKHHNVAMDQTTVKRYRAPAEGERDQTMQTKFDMADIAFDVPMETSVYISPLPIWCDQREHPEDCSNPALLRNMARDGIEV